MPRPIPTPVGHFTHIDHLPTIAVNGLLCDTHAQKTGLLTTEAGNPGIKARRRERMVTTPGGGSVSDYVPFYFKSRSPMMFAIHCGNVATFTGDEHDLVYLLTTVEILIEHGLSPVFTDRNAALAVTKYSEDIAELDNLVDWEVMKLRIWRNTDEDPDRVERRMAECLVFEQVPWEAFTEIVVHDSTREARVQTDLDTLGIAIPPIHVSPDSYF